MRRKTRETSRKKYYQLIFAAVIIVLLLIIFYSTKHNASTGSNNSNLTKSVASTNNSKKTIKLIATGDFVFHDSVNVNAKQSNDTYNYSPYYTDFTSIFKAADIRFCNQVTPVGGEQFGISGYPKFNAPLSAVDDMAGLGCNLINMASNHSFDNSQDAINANVAEWAKQPNILAAAGQNRSSIEHDTVHYFTVKGVKFAFLAYTTYINTDAPATNDYGVNVYSRSFATQQINDAKQNGAQIIIVSMRWGTEYSSDVTSEQLSESQFLADQGVTVVLGHGSHVLEPVTTLTGINGNHTLVWYSLGNFLNSQTEPEALFNGLAVINFDISSKGIQNVSYLPLYMHYEWTQQQSNSQDLLARHNLHLYLLENTNQSMIDSQQLATSVPAQTSRITKILSTEQTVPLINSKQYYSQ